MIIIFPNQQAGNSKIDEIVRLSLTDVLQIIFFLIICYYSGCYIANSSCHIFCDVVILGDVLKKPGLSWT